MTTTAPLQNRYLRALHPGTTAAFTLVEMLVVMAVIVTLLGIVITNSSRLFSGGDLTTSSGELSNLFEQARAYALANNTYVFVGLEEADGTQSESAAPQVLGNGRIIAAVVASKDGTGSMGTSGSNLVSINKPQIYRNIHLADLHTQASGSLARVTTDSSVSFIYTAADGTPQISTSKSLSFSWPLGTTASTCRYQFTDTTGAVIQFNPQGMSQVVESTGPRSVSPWLEIGLQGTHGAAVNSGPNVAVLQIEGITGAVKIYRP